MTSILGPEKYVSLTTYTKDGRPKSTPVWFALSGDNEIHIVTDDDSWKAKRVRRDPKVELVASDSTGNVEKSAAVFSGIASIHSASNEEFEKANANLTAKYGIYYRIFRFMAKVRRKTQCAIVVKLSIEGGA